MKNLFLISIAVLLVIMSIVVEPEHSIIINGDEFTEYFKCVKNSNYKIGNLALAIQSCVGK